MKSENLFNDQNHISKINKLVLEIIRECYEDEKSDHNANRHYVKNSLYRSIHIFYDGIRQLSYDTRFRNIDCFEYTMNYLFNIILKNDIDLMKEILSDVEVCDLFAPQIRKSINTDDFFRIFNFVDEDISNFLDAFFSNNQDATEFIQSYIQNRRSCFQELTSSLHRHLQGQSVNDPDMILKMQQRFEIFSTVVNKNRNVTTDIFLKYGDRESDATLNAVMVYACNNNKLEQITNILKNGELKMKDSLKMLKFSLINMANDMTNWKFEGDSYRKDKKMFNKVVENFDLITEGLDYDSYKDNNNIVDMVVKFGIDTNSVQLNKMKQLKLQVGTSEAFHGWQALSEGSINYIKSIPIPKHSTVNEKPNEFCWNLFKKLFTSKITSGYIWNWHKPTVLMSIMAQLDFDEYDKFLAQLMSVKKSHHIRAIDSYVRCSLNKDIDTKLARKYRSESKNVAFHAAKGLIQGRSKYDEVEFRKIVSQFKDSKHDDVVKYFVDHLPKDLLTLFIANPLANKTILSRRMSN